MPHIWSNLRFAWRTLKAKPAFTTVAVLSLALGIGANTAIFSVVDAALLRSLPFRNTDALLAIGDRQPCCDFVGFSPGEYLDYKRQNTTLAGFAAITWREATLTGGAEAQELKGRAVSTNFFDVLGAHAEIGRLMSERIDKPGQNRVAVISDALWRSRFAADPSVIGRTITVSDHPFTVVGVLAPHEAYPPGTEIWLSPRIEVPEFADGVMQHLGAQDMYGTHWISAIGRLKPGVSLARARAEMHSISNCIDTTHDEPGHSAVLKFLQSNLVESVRPALAILSAAVIVLLLLACANLAGLLIARVTGRTRELAIRVAIGANRAELMRLLLSESLLLAFCGGVLGLAFAFGALGLLRHYSPYELPTGLAPSLNAEVFLFGVAISFSAALLTGLLPALHAGRVDVNESLKESSKSSAGFGTQRLRRVLVTGEIALSIVLLIGAFLLIRSFGNLLAVHPGFDPSAVTTARISLSRSRYRTLEQTTDFWNRLLARVRRLPGVDSAGVSSDVPVGGVSQGGEFEVEGHPVGPKNKSQYADRLYISPQTISTLRIPLLSGRDFSERDRQNSLPVVLINKTFADRYFPHQDPVGHRIRNGVGAPWETIVGVVSNVKWDGLAAPPGLDTYRDYAQREELTDAALLVRMHPGMSLAAADLQKIVRDIDKDVPVFQVRPLSAYIDESLQQRRFLLGVLTAFSALAMLLAAVGLYAVLAYSVEQRRREIGVRVAVGASHADVLGLVLRECAIIAGVGVFLGLLSTLWLSAFLKSVLFGVTGTDLTAYASAVLLIAGVALAASAIPARRAARIDPVSALRYE